MNREKAQNKSQMLTTEFKIFVNLVKEALSICTEQLGVAHVFFIT